MSDDLYSIDPMLPKLTPRVCKSCGLSKFMSDFYRQKDMKDGYLIVCKACSISARTLYSRTLKGRASKKKSMAKYRSTPGGAELHRITNSKYSKNNRTKIEAHQAVKRAIYSGALKPEPCEVCGEKVAHAHHDDYTKPLSVRWLCPFHHVQHHKGSAQ